MYPTNAAPATVFDGIDDESKRAVTRPAIATPTHLPLVPLYTAWGPTTATVESAASVTDTYGIDTFNLRKPFFTHQTQLQQLVSAQGNQCMIQRLLPADVGPKARLLLSLDLVADAIPQYQRNVDGSYALDENGAKKPVSGAGATIPGYIGKWVLNQWLETEDAPEAFGQVQTRDGSLVSSTNAQSTLYPIAEFEATFFGSRGNQLGLRLIAPTASSSPALNTAQAERVQSFIYQMQMLQRDSALSSPTVINTQSGSQFAAFSFKPQAFDENTDLNLDFQNVLAASYSVHESGQVPTYGPFENAKIYQANLEAVLALIGNKEAPRGTLPVATMTADSDELYSVNPFTAVNYDGVPYYTLQLQGATQGGAIFSTASSFFAAGATDGTMTPASYDADVAAWAGGFNLTDLAKYPFSIIYDSGFSLATKLKLMPLLGKRPDLSIIFSTQSALEEQNTPDEDSSTARAISAALANYPESTLYGTSVCRAMIIGSSGYLLKSNNTALLPLTLQVASIFAAYMGAANGIWSNAVPPDENPQNIISIFKGVNAADKTASARSADWSTGLVYIENFDMESQYFPALASVYNNDTSILKGFMNVLIATDLIKVAHAARRFLSGGSKLTDAQFIKKSNALIQAMIKGKYDARVSVIPTTYFSTLDQQRGYSWSVTLDMYGNNMRTVGSASVVARRMSELPTT